MIPAAPGPLTRQLRPGWGLNGKEIYPLITQCDILCPGPMIMAKLRLSLGLVKWATRIAVVAPAVRNLGLAKMVC